MRYINFVTSGRFSPIRLASSIAITTALAINAYKQFATKAADSTGFPEVLALNGFSYILFAENYCGAVPVSTQLPDGTFSFGGPESTNTLLDSAISKFNQALSMPGAP